MKKPKNLQQLIKKIEKEFEEEFAGRIDWMPVSGEIPEGINPQFVRHARGEVVEVIKEFLRQALKRVAKETARAGKLVEWQRKKFGCENERGEKTDWDIAWREGYDYAVEEQQKQLNEWLGEEK